MLFRDNDSEFASQAMDLWAYRNGAKIDSRSGQAYRQRFCRKPQTGVPADRSSSVGWNGAFWAECLDTHCYVPGGGTHLIESWTRECSESCPHQFLVGRAPSEFAIESVATRVLNET